MEYNVSASSLFASLARGDEEEPLCCCLEFEGDNPSCPAHEYLGNGDEEEGSDNRASAQWTEHGYY